MKNLLITTILLFAFWSGNAQITSAESKLKEIKKPEELGWAKGLKMNISGSQTSLNNWVAGGQNSISVNGFLNSFLRYGHEKYVWENTLDLGYGVIKQGKKDFFKSDDRVEFNTKVGYPVKNNLKITGLINFKTQMAPGYASPDDLTVISHRLSPAYTLGAVGIDGSWIEGLSVFIAPITGKTTYVGNEALVAAGSFGLDPGQSFRAELGGYIRTVYKTQFKEDLSLTNKLDLFSNYLDGPQFVDVNWAVLFLVTLNKYLTASLQTHLIYDHDILIGADTDGDNVADEFKPRVQFKEIIGIGLTFTL